MGTKKQLVDVFGSRLFANIIAAITMVASLVSIFKWKGAVVLGASVILCLVCVVYVVISNRGARRRAEMSVLEILSGIQDEYIREPRYITTVEHGEHSKEQYLQEGGEGVILTNSLVYDIFYCREIVDNILRGARYTYILPNSATLQDQLYDFISTIQGEFTEQKIDPSKADTYYTNTKFWILSTGVSCLYNFARFHQPKIPRHIEGFVQSWWYIHAAEACKEDPKAPMLSNEITGPNDQENLYRALRILMNPSIATMYTGLQIFAHRESLAEFLGSEVRYVN